MDLVCGSLTVWMKQRRTVRFEDRTNPMQGGGKRFALDWII